MNPNDVESAGERVIDARTRLFGVAGAPVAHSLSPVMHNAALQATGYPAVYLAFHVTDVAGAVVGMRALGIAGLSVTLPHKVAVMACLDDIDEVARRIGAVNTIVQRGGRLVGFNTDCEGALAALKEKVDPAGREVALLGAGGAGRAIGFGLVAAGARVSLFNRGEERGRELARSLGVTCRPLSRLGETRADILINTTPVGMASAADRSPVPPGLLRADMVVMDIIYNPLETLLLKAARAAGCVTIDGAAMFVAQGALQFRLWTGLAPPVGRMRRAVLNALRGG